MKVSEFKSPRSALSSSTVKSPSEFVNNLLPANKALQIMWPNKRAPQTRQKKMCSRERGVSGVWAHANGGYTTDDRRNG